MPSLLLRQLSGRPSDVSPQVASLFSSQKWQNQVNLIRKVKAWVCTFFTSGFPTWPSPLPLPSLVTFTDTPWKNWLGSYSRRLEVKLKENYDFFFDDQVADMENCLARGEWRSGGTKKWAKENKKLNNIIYHNYNGPQNILSWSIVIAIYCYKRWFRSHGKGGEVLDWSNHKVLSHKASWPPKEKTGFPIYNQDETLILQQNQTLEPHIFTTIFVLVVSG